jgi:nucleoside-diphosphate-sugar epimerase
MMGKANFELVKKIVDVLIELKTPDKRLIQISSVGCYGATTRFVGLDYMVTENEVEKPIGLYEETKTKADDYIRDMLGKNNKSASYTILRPTNVFGVSMKSKAILNIALMVKKGRFFYISDKYAVSTYVHVDDVAQSVRLVVENMPASCNQTYIVSDDCDQRTFIEALADVLSVKQPRLVVPLFFLTLGIFLGQKLSNSFPVTLSGVTSLTSKVSFSNKEIPELGFKSLFSVYKKEVVNPILKKWSLK